MFEINLHSMVDMITNSSTELFVLDKNKSIEVVRDILNEAISLHNKATNKNYKFEDIFEEPYFGSGCDAIKEFSDYYESHIKEGIIISGADDNSIPYWMFDFIESVFGDSTERFHMG